MDHFCSLQFDADTGRAVARFLLAAGRQDTLAHCRAVAGQAVLLAERFGVDPARAGLAALCHDLAAAVPNEERLAVARALGLVPDPIQCQLPMLLHGPIAAAVLARRLNLTDDDLLNAIAFHTTCRAGASALELVVFVADKIALDPAAPVQSFVPAVRSAATESLALAAWVYLDWGVRNGRQHGWILHPDTLAAHAELAPD